MSKPTSSPAQQLAWWADQLRDISALGLRFSDNIYDREHYQTIQDMAIEMVALATGSAITELEPLRKTVFARPTPICTGDAAIINEAGELLLIQRADNQKWAMPGGAMAVGENPVEGVIREALEETGVRCEPIKLIGIYDSRLCGATTVHHLYMLLFLCKPLPNDKPASPPSHAHEVLNSGWFREDGLPNDIDPGHVIRIGHAFQAWQGQDLAFFDR